MTPTAELVCDDVCLDGWKNGKEMERIIEAGKKWNAFFEELGL